MKRHLLYMLIFAVATAVAQDVHIAPRVPTARPAAIVERAGFVEVTRTDFTKVERVRSTQLTTFGAALGDEREKALGAIRAAGMAITTKPRSEWLGVYDGNDEVAILLFQDGRLAKVAWQKPMTRYLAGDSAKLLDDTIARPESPLRLQLLGREDSRTVEGGALPLVTCSYDREGLRISELSTSTQRIILVHLVPPAKPR